MLIDPARLEREYCERRPDRRDSEQMVKFGTSGHRGTSLRGSFNEAHILAITQAICDYRAAHGTDVPVYTGRTRKRFPRRRAVTPTAVISRAILVYNRGRKDHFADGIVITPSHNPPQDGGFKYNPANGGPADTHTTKWIEGRANELLRKGSAGVKRMSFASALSAGTTHQQDFVQFRLRKELRNRKNFPILPDAEWSTGGGSVYESDSHLPALRRQLLGLPDRATAARRGTERKSRRVDALELPRDAGASRGVMSPAWLAHRAHITPGF